MQLNFDFCLYMMKKGIVGQILLFDLFYPPNYLNEVSKLFSVLGKFTADISHNGNLIMKILKI